MGGVSIDWGMAVIVDEFGYVYTAGLFNESADFDPGAGNYELTSTGFFDIFISKLDSNGSLVWAKGMGGTGEDRGMGIAVGNNGNVHTVGYFTGTGDFDPGSGTNNLTSAGETDIL